MRFVVYVAACCVLSLPALSQESGTEAASTQQPRRVPAPGLRTPTGPCSVAMPNPLQRASARFPRLQERFGQRGPNRPGMEIRTIPPPPGPFAFRELTAPAPPCDEVGRSRVPLFEREDDNNKKPEQKPEL